MNREFRNAVLGLGALTLVPQSALADISKAEFDDPYFECLKEAIDETLGNQKGAVTDVVVAESDSGKILIITSGPLADSDTDRMYAVGQVSVDEAGRLDTFSVSAMLENVYAQFNAGLLDGQWVVQPSTDPKLNKFGDDIYTDTRERVSSCSPTG